jgi:hypothetical protein
VGIHHRRRWTHRVTHTSALGPDGAARATKRKGAWLNLLSYSTYPCERRADSQLDERIARVRQELVLRMIDAIRNLSTTLGIELLAFSEPNPVS